MKQEQKKKEKKENKVIELKLKPVTGQLNTKMCFNQKDKKRQK